MKYSMVVVGAMAAAVAAQVETPEFDDCGRLCANNMLAPSKAQELGCEANDFRCLCQNQNFIYGLRDCSMAVCSDDGTPRQVVDFGVAICASAGVAINPTGTEPTVTGTNALTNVATGTDSVETIFTTWTTGGTAVVSPITTSTADSDSEGGAGGALVTTFTSDGTAFVSTLTGEAGAIESSISGILSSASADLSSIRDEISSQVGSVSSMLTSVTGGSDSTATTGVVETTTVGNDDGSSTDNPDATATDGDDGSPAAQMTAAPMLMAAAGLAALLF